MDASRIKRGVMLKCRFPYDDAPHLPGMKPHYCLAVTDALHFEGKVYVLVAYGTSKLDEDLLRAHQGLILSVPSIYIKGATLPEATGHFVADHVALLPLTSDWIYEDFFGTLDFVATAAQENDARRSRLYESFLAAEKAMLAASRDLVKSFFDSRQPGLKPGKTLR
ncbi:hypothetical protein [Burkholderia sp. Ac-20365]|uniref:hypothetical protein n=1 Tax=Burkholderia sp. Ac-20365 TaxID=2703897 RepID=UPI00197C461F|nr:hypothetical protein [Burkholderia sp. Ac-20365]MBN3761290.1 hypothetical protein [Burkholderia sp. Ac-20365]